MKYTMTTPCDQCPFLKSVARSAKRPGGFTLQRLEEFAAGDFACHRSCDVDDETSEYVARDSDTPHCAGALIFNEKRGRAHQMMRIAERLGAYDARKLDMKAAVR